MGGHEATHTTIKVTLRSQERPARVNTTKGRQHLQRYVHTHMPEG